MQKQLSVDLITHTPDPEKVVAAAARLCYSPDDMKDLLNNMTPERVEKFISKLASLGHESPFEHVSFTFGIQGVSRVFSHQHVRHRHQSISQRSQRYNDEADCEIIVPPSIEANPQALDAFLGLMGHINKIYEELVELGIPKEDARYALSNATETKLVVTLDARSLFNYFQVRCCNRAQWEIRACAWEMLRLVNRVAPNIFRYSGPACLRGACPEGTMTCGSPYKLLPQ